MARKESGRRRSIDYRQLVVRWVTGTWNERREELVDAMLAPNCRLTVEGVDGSIGVDEFKVYRRNFLNAIPDPVVHIFSVVVEGDTAVQVWRATGTHLGTGLGVPPSGRRVDFSGMTSYQFRGRLIVAGADRWNRGEMIASLLQVRMAEISASAGLTRRESQVALLMAERFSHTEIATDLGIKPNTARRHCEMVIRKLGVSRRQDVAKRLGKIAGSALARQGDGSAVGPTRAGER